MMPPLILLISIIPAMSPKLLDLFCVLEYGFKDKKGSCKTQYKSIGEADLGVQVRQPEYCSQPEAYWLLMDLAYFVAQLHAAGVSPQVQAQAPESAQAVESSWAVADAPLPG